MASLLTDGLVGWWKLDDGSGNTAVDSSTGGHNGDLTSHAPTWTAPSNAQIKYTNPYCLLFNGTTQYVSTYDYSPTRTTPFSFSIWVYSTSNTGQHGVFGKGDTGSADWEYQLVNNAGTLTYTHWGTGGSAVMTIASGTSISLNTWYHVVVTYDGANNGAMYLNGNPVGYGTATNTFGDRANNLNIGRCYYTSGIIVYHAGMLDDFRIFSRKLLIDEVKALYNAEAVFGGTTEADYHRSLSAIGLVGHWKLDEGSGATTKDSSGMGNPGTLVSSPTWTASVPTVDFYNPYALSFDGSSQYITINSMNVASGSYTFAFWAKSDPSWNASGAYVFDSHTGRLVIGWNVTTSGKLSWYDGAWHHYGTIPADTNWHHYAVTLQGGGNGTVYIDGSANAGNGYTAKAIGGSFTTIAAANHSDSNSSFFRGTLDDFRIYNRVLQPSEISHLAAGHSPEDKIMASTIYAGTIQ